MIKKVLIANRGEIALRIIRACKSLGIKSVAVYSTADKNSMHIKMADESICIGPPNANESYRNIKSIIAATEQSDADAIHPGYGFLSENEEFAHVVEQHNIKFIGPSSKHIKLLGDKVESKRIMQKYGITTIPGSEALSTAQDGLDYAKSIGFPVIIKASNGGGGKGIRIAKKEDEFLSNFAAVDQEASALFGKGGSIYVEKYFERPRHVEFQVLSDGKKAVHLFERECSLQRRRQKVLEEAPSNVLTDQQRAEWGEKISNMIAAIGYEGVGTLEFLYQDNQLYFMEMNTRLQVEHTITEEITGIDLVQQQIKVASGIPLEIKQSDIKINGHAMQCRITAEDPITFTPSPGLVKSHLPALGPYARVDTMLYNGYQIQPYYDSLISKLVVKGSNREECIRNLKQALKEYIIEGPKTTLPLFHKLIEDEEFQKADFTINWLENWIQNS
ncbi:acetyl-CoA carboxylase biotin carboxylase subunit [Candidatus Cytomitobacter indipagum]|uniref:biotin carboxylase n=1 Tax=Candidatus Cytomitobacter indipagum TaxID=2601575 RepID=A0A5C0UG96_9PROT|nr:acetyl-CoA carboxylase biotin carboxylase subunit [Candidatus Cytomitobacter indipagum]QEK38064.1 acetyl-CoA carboxylase biotin carboxylase subunit [Candidatus Cytomitobacter indipagum]